MRGKQLLRLIEETRAKADELSAALGEAASSQDRFCALLYESRRQAQAMPDRSRKHRSDHAWERFCLDSHGRAKGFGYRGGLDAWIELLLIKR